VLGRENSRSLRHCIGFHSMTDHLPRQARDTHWKS
jgi:hypothetical protein